VIYVNARHRLKQEQLVQFIKNVDSYFLILFDLELTIGPAHQRDFFRTMILLYLMLCSIQKIMIAK